MDRARATQVVLAIKQGTAVQGLTGGLRFRPTRGDREHLRGDINDPAAKLCARPSIMAEERPVVSENSAEPRAGIRRGKIRQTSPQRLLLVTLAGWVTSRLRIKSPKPMPALRNQRSIGRCKTPPPKTGLKVFRIPWVSRWDASSHTRRGISMLRPTSTVVDWVASPLSFWVLRPRKNFMRMIRRTLSASSQNLRPPRKQQHFTSRHSQRAKHLRSKSKLG